MKSECSMNRRSLGGAQGRAVYCALAGVLLATTITNAWAAPAEPVDISTYERSSTATAPYTSIRVLDTEKMPIAGPKGSLGVGQKTLFESKQEGGGALRMLYVAPGAEGALMHYHTFHEWAYNIQGDFTNNESTNPNNTSGPLQRFREGNFLSRPPYSIHGGERGRMKWMQSQIGAVILIMEEANVRKGTLTVDPTTRDLPVAERGGGNPEWRNVKYWSTPRIIDTLEKMPWQDVDGAQGLHAKYLIDDPSHGFRATMWYLEAGAPTPQQFRPHYYKQAHQFNFVVNGDLNIDAYAGPGQKKESYKLLKHYFVERPPMSAFGIAPTGASEAGVVWLEVTYAKGNRWSDSPIEIEAPNYF